MHQTSLLPLCNFVYKRISKIFTDRLSLLLPRIISSPQCAFIKGRSLMDCVYLAQELTHDLNRKVYGRNVILKLDMQKAPSGVVLSFCSPQALWIC